ncbi:hypothetical protein CEUSTIGMA_g9939.t1 [Chlamydomonas eustigma]|uniref:Uncharacterized protein n=1 Tax=Chlamydomonas eustigma TaxID=1157962 RepID=A0A250XHW7_9CHLO|nr:hypothetical protein CEUSTIGMA_g9939.t1 [Chlamydomonas eustigma]|eukprot:GAX82512.1 hypothetical protein CEUSTIGMA_g9939.t1 [Chlamydomonas eustigma]
MGSETKDMSSQPLFGGLESNLSSNLDGGNSANLQSNVSNESADALIGRAAKRHNWTAARTEMMNRLLRVDGRQLAELEETPELKAAVGNLRQASETRDSGSAAEYSSRRPSESSSSQLLTPHYGQSRQSSLLFETSPKAQELRQNSKSQHSADFPPPRFMARRSDAGFVAPLKDETELRGTSAISTARALLYRLGGGSSMRRGVGWHSAHSQDFQEAMTSNATGGAQRQQLQHLSEKQGSAAVLAPQGADGNVGVKVSEVASCFPGQTTPSASATMMSLLSNKEGRSSESWSADADIRNAGGSRGAALPLISEPRRREAEGNTSATLVKTSKPAGLPKDLKELAEHLKKQRLERELKIGERAQSSEQPALLPTFSSSQRHVPFRSQQARCSGLSKSKSGAGSLNLNQNDGMTSSGSSVAGSQSMRGRPSSGNLIVDALAAETGRNMMQPLLVPPAQQQGGLWDLLESLRARRLAAMPTAPLAEENVNAVARLSRANSRASLEERVSEWKLQSAEALAQAMGLDHAPDGGSVNVQGGDRVSRSSTADCEGGGYLQASSHRGPIGGLTLESRRMSIGASAGSGGGGTVANTGSGRVDLRSFVVSAAPRPPLEMQLAGRAGPSPRLDWTMAPADWTMAPADSVHLRKQQSRQ